jgi:hypothetical protein
MSFRYQCLGCSVAHSVLHPSSVFVFRESESTPSHMTQYTAFSFLQSNVHPMSYRVTLPLYAMNVDAIWASEMWRCVSNRTVDSIKFECGTIMTVLPCFGYILVNDELFATFRGSVKNMLPSDRETATTVWQLLVKNDDRGLFDVELSNMGENMYALQCNASQKIWMERIRFVHDVCSGFAFIQRLFIRRAIRNKIKSHHFTKLAAFIPMVTSSSNRYWRAIQDTGILSEHIVLAYLGLLGNNCILEMRGEKRIKTKGSMKFS